MLVVCHGRAKVLLLFLVVGNKKIIKHSNKYFTQSTVLRWLGICMMGMPVSCGETPKKA